MKAFHYENPEDGLVLKDLPIPEPLESQVQLRIMAAGICHSDCHIVEGKGDGWLGKKPMILGHEVAGVVTKTGAGVTHVQAGDRVAVVITCHPAEERLDGEAIGLGYDGGYAQFAVAPANRVLKIADNISFAHAAVTTDALSTSYHAIVREAGAAPGITIGIVGMGGLGMAGLRFAALKGATVYGVDVAESKFQEAIEQGATACFKSLTDAKHIKFDVIVDFFGASATTSAAIEAVKIGGKVVGVGLQSPTVAIETGGANGYIFKAVTLVGSLGSSSQDVQEVLELLGRKEIDPLLVEVPFEDIPQTIELLGKGNAAGRYWTDPSKAK
ncbi:hypothetical protein ACHAQA_003500 [Verticillium albo-atrum]